VSELVAPAVQRMAAFTVSYISWAVREGALRVSNVHVIEYMPHAAEATKYS
jgi:hypothetical protein